MSCPATTVGRVMIIFSISLLNNKSSAMLAAKSDLPEPALPFNTVTVLFKMCSFALFCSSFNWISNLIGPLGFLFDLKTSCACGVLLKSFI